MTGAKEIVLAVMATTLSLVVIFLPVAFMGGLVGRFWNSFGLTATFAILVSLLVAFTLTPMLSARMLKPVVNPVEPSEASAKGMAETERTIGDPRRRTSMPFWSATTIDSLSGV